MLGGVCVAWVVRRSPLSTEVRCEWSELHVTVDKEWADARVVCIARDGRVVCITCALLCGRVSPSRKLQRVLLALTRNNEVHARRSVTVVSGIKRTDILVRGPG